MNDDIEHYIFDFEREVADLRDSLGDKLGKVLFLDVDVNESGTRFLHIIGPEELKTENRLSFVRSNIAATYRQEPRESSFQQFMYNGRTLEASYSFISFRHECSSHTQFCDEYKSLQQLSTLYHETAHSLIRQGPSTDEDHPFRESAADAYAMLMLLQRFGRDVVPVLLFRSWDRSHSAMNGQTKHMTTPVIDQIVADSARCNFSKMTQDDIIALAVDYAEKWTPTPDMLAAVRSYANKNDYFAAAATCLQSADKFSFYIGAKFFQPFLASEEFTLNGERLVFATEAEQRQYAEAIKKGATGMRLRDIFDEVARPRKAGPAINAAIRTVPQGQRVFSLNFS